MLRNIGFTAALAVLAVSVAHASVLDRPYFKANGVVVVIGGNDFSEDGGTAPVAVDFLLLTDVSSGNAAPDLIAADGVTTHYGNGTGHRASSDASNVANAELILENQTFGGVFTSAPNHSVLDAADSFSAFGLDETTDIDFQNRIRYSRFFVASNAPFDIFARADNLSTDGDFTALSYDSILYDLVIQTQRTTGPLGWGTSAQNPSTGGSGINSAIVDLADMSAGDTLVFNGGRRTAASRGTLMQQAVSFQSRYRLHSGEAGNRYDFSMGTGTIGADVTYTVYTP